MPRGSWTSSIVGFALAVLLVTWALTQLVELLDTYWPLLLGTIVVAVAISAGIAFWQRRDYR